MKTIEMNTQVITIVGKNEIYTCSWQAAACAQCKKWVQSIILKAGTLEWPMQRKSTLTYTGITNNDKTMQLEPLLMEGRTKCTAIVQHGCHLHAQSWEYRLTVTEMIAMVIESS